MDEQNFEPAMPVPHGMGRLKRREPHAPAWQELNAPILGGLLRGLLCGAELLTGRSLDSSSSKALQVLSSGSCVCSHMLSPQVRDNQGQLPSPPSLLSSLTCACLISTGHVPGRQEGDGEMRVTGMNASHLSDASSVT